ncbi:MAG: HAD-IA family hydrolase [Rhizobiaceae bacterium]|nr:HAD-IA family hydrolase [Rhizobiaceae bacterium]MCV0407373.1 HAD-IA family hydrolase [Rhizobiaceae bacterium]
MEGHRVSLAGGRLKAVLFDLDGTLVDSVPDLHGAVATLLERHGFVPLDLCEVRTMVGDGVRALVARAFRARGRPVSGTELDALTDEMMDIYGARLTALTTLMPGAREALAACRAAGLGLGCVTNKPQAASEAILAGFGLSHYLPVVIGGDAGRALKPAPDIALAALDRLGVAPAEAVLVGDGAADAGCGRAAGMTVVLVRGGYGMVPAESLDADHLIDSLADLAALLQLDSDRQELSEDVSPLISSK